MNKKIEDQLQMKLAFSCKEKLNLQNMDKSLNKSCPDLKDLETKSTNDPIEKKLKKMMGGCMIF